MGGEGEGGGGGTEKIVWEDKGTVQQIRKWPWERGKSKCILVLG